MANLDTVVWECLSKAEGVCEQTTEQYLVEQEVAHIGQQKLKN